MRKRWYLLTVVPPIVAVLAAALELRETPVPASVRSPAQFAAFLDGAVPRWMTRDHVPGLCVGLVSADEQFLRCYGVADADGSRVVDGHSRFAVASVSKTFAALAVLTLAGDGAFSLDDRAETHLRSWHFPDGRFDATSVTIRQLLTHTAGVGVPSYGGASTPPPGETTRAVLEGRGPGREPVVLVQPPGAGFLYSGGGFVVLQQLVEDVSGLPFERFAIDRVFRPLEMTDTSFSWGEPRADDTAGHDVAGRFLPRRNYGAAMAPGAMVTTARDMMRFVAAFADGKIPARLGWPDAMWTSIVAPDHPGYGMAVVVGRTNGHLVVGHSGTTMGYNAGFTTMPLERNGWFVLENGNGGPFLKAELDRAFTEWKAGAIDPRYRAMQWVRAAVAFAGALLAGAGIVLLVFFALTYTHGHLAVVTRDRIGVMGFAVRLVVATASVAAVAGWLAFFHTDAFYPAFTTAWLPYPFRYVTLGIVLLALRTALACVFARPRAGLRAGAMTTIQPSRG
jgi:CubicO group peptidase (beta-lactamase class C family)